MPDDTRLIEVAFPIREVSLDSVHEKSVRHGHISTLHMWPARRPLAASRAVLLATLLRDPGSADARRKLLAEIAGHVVEVADSTGKTHEETEGGVLRWGRESDPRLEEFREEIRNAFDGRPPRVLDPFAGGGAIPLEAMRLGCEVVAADLNPVAWFILRCTLHYPRLVTERRQLPTFALNDPAFMTRFLKAEGFSKKALHRALAQLGHVGEDPPQMAMEGAEVAEDLPKADFSWHLRAWAGRVLEAARSELADRYPTYAEFEPVRRKGRRKTDYLPRENFRPREPRLLRPDEKGRVSTNDLNAEFSSRYLENHANPRWIAKSTVAYLWARTSECPSCRAEIPLLKTGWLCKKGKKRVLLKMVPREDRTGVAFELQADVPEGLGNAASRREHDKRTGAGTMSKSGATCPCCRAIATMKDLRARGRSGLLGERMVAVVVNGQTGKEYRLPRTEEIDAADVRQEELDEVYGEVPFGLPSEPTPKAGLGAARAFSIDGYGIDVWKKIFTNRQLLMIGQFVLQIRNMRALMEDHSDDWSEAFIAYNTVCVDRLIDYSSAICSWHNSREIIRNTFGRFALPMVWDYAECNPFSNSTGDFSSSVEWVSRFIAHVLEIRGGTVAPLIHAESAIQNPASGEYEIIVTDPPYYDAIPYSDLMDFFYVWLRRTLGGLSADYENIFKEEFSPKWNPETRDGELIDDASRFGGDRLASKKNYEDGMARAFSRFYEALRDGGRLVIVFANKQPDAWETLVSALIRAGFVVTGSWPIQTEMQNRQRSLTSAALSSSIWLVCRKRPLTAPAGWDGLVLAEMRKNIDRRTHDFWDAGIRGPDFIWAATGPALEAFSRHPVVKKTNSPGQFLTVAEFLRRVRRMVVAFVVSRLLSGETANDELDDLTTYYLLHRRDFRLNPAPAGACILYALSCNLSDTKLAGRAELLVRAGRADSAGDDETGAEASGSGGELRLKPWNRRLARDLGEDSADGRPPPLIDCIHKLMQLWKTGEQSRVDGYLDTRGLWDSEIFSRVIQALIELADRGSEERATLETIQNHIQGHASASMPLQRSLL